MYKESPISFILYCIERNGGFSLITHFQWKPLFEDKNLPGWRISFYFKKQACQAIYHKNGEIEWTGAQPPTADEESVKSMIHELMLFHVYE
jgi:hypothetical protein